VVVRVWEESGSLLFEVRDDGPGFDIEALPRTRRGMGLATMRERAQEIGARLDIRTRAGAGTTVSVSVPIRAAR